MSGDDHLRDVAGSGTQSQSSACFVLEVVSESRKVSVYDVEAAIEIRS